MMDIRPIRTEQDYEWALAEVAQYFVTAPKLGSIEADRFDVLSALIQAYEDQHWPIEAPDPVATIEHWMEMHGFSQSDLATVLGSRSRASEILRRKRSLTLNMAYRLHHQWAIPADILIKPYHVAIAA